MLKQADFQYSGKLEPPSPRVTSEWVELVQNLLTRLDDFAPQLENLAVNQSLDDLAQSRVSMNLLAGFCTVQITPLGADVWLRGSGDFTNTPNVPLQIPAEELAGLFKLSATS